MRSAVFLFVVFAIVAVILTVFRATVFAVFAVLVLLVLLLVLVFHNSLLKKIKYWKGKPYKVLIILLPLQKAGVNPRSLVPPYKADKLSTPACLRAYIHTHCKSTKWGIRFDKEYRF